MIRPYGIPNELAALFIVLQILSYFDLKAGEAISKEFSAQGVNRFIRVTKPT